MRIGYNTNGFAHHRLEDALSILAELGYESVAITLDYHALNPFASDLRQQLSHCRHLLEKLGLHSVVETGARFLLDPWHKHQPTLLSLDKSARERRLDFLFRAVDIAQELSSDAVSFWSGTPEKDSDQNLCMCRLVEGCLKLGDYAGERGVRLGFEPEPGMLVDTMDRFEELRQKVAHPFFGLTIDIGHLHCLGELPIVKHLSRWKDSLWNIHIEDMRRGVHDHLMFGDGDIDFAPVLHSLRDIHYTGGLHVELSRHSHDAVDSARRALAFLQAIQ
jgi:L-ribulose-5-phosphate 3-epimerase